MQRLTNSVVETSGEKSIRGLVAPYYDGTPATQTELPDGTIERLMPGCFSDCVAKTKTGEMTVHMYFNHNTDKALGATPDTLTLSEDRTGLWADATLDLDDPDAQKLQRGTTRKLFKGMSFGAAANERNHVKYSKENGKLVRSVVKFHTMWDVSPVYLPVYKSTGFTIRSLEQSLQEINRIQDEAKVWFEEQERMEETRKRIEANKKLRQ